MRAPIALVLVLGCSGSDRPAAETPVAPIDSETEPATKSEPEQAPCPEQAMARTIGTLGNPPIADGDYRTAKARVCLRLAGDRWFVIGSIGDHDPDSQSEEGFGIVRFIADDAGQIIARAPDDGASSMTGVPEGKYQAVDLDGDGSDEVLEKIDVFGMDPTRASEVLRVYAVDGDKLEVPVTVVLAEGAEGDPEGGPICRASYAVADTDSGRAIDIEVTAGLDYERDVDDIELRTTDPRERIECMPPGAYRIQLSGGEPALSKE